METYRVIADLDELHWFFDYVVRKPKIHEAYSFCMSCRHKKLTKEEMQKMDFATHSDEMMDPNTVFASQTGEWNFNKWKKGLERYECNINSYTTRGGYPFPAKALVWYCTPNPTDERNAVKSLKAYIQTHEDELVSSAIKNSRTGVEESLYKLCHALVKFKRLQFDSTGTKYWVDFDMDLTDTGKENREAILKTWKYYCEQKVGKGNVVIVETSGGYHTLMNKEVIHWNPNEFANNFASVYSANIEELKYNTNCMLPTPGTYQYGKVVRVVNKEDFE